MSEAEYIPDIARLMEWEAGALDPEETIDLFACLIRTGLAWSLQGHYGRMAQTLISNGYITHDGEITERGHAFDD